jgi:vancomycin permeability regulator SanA
MIIAAICALTLSAQSIVSSYHQYVIDTPENASDVLANNEQRTGIVFGSGIDPAGVPRPILTNRLDAALDLYSKEAIDRIIVSGYNPAPDYNEPAAMRRYLAGQNVPAEAIVEDRGGDNTFATCERSKNTHRVNAAILVSQPSHLDRAIYLCRSLGIEAYGYAANHAHQKRWRYVQSAREAVGNVKALLNARFPSVEIFH